ncbi:MAG: GNAT family N-acetyltransferase [Cellulosilyticaceae bacterium]
MLVYREAKKGDEEQLLALIKVALGAHGLALEVEGADADVADLEKHYLQNNGWFQVVEDEGRIIGSVGIYKIDDEKCELRKMYLYPEYQGKKIGKQLMENALEQAKVMGFGWMLLQTSSKLVKALPLYEKYGFVDDAEGEICSRCDIAMIRCL